MLPAFVQSPEFSSLEVVPPVQPAGQAAVPSVVASRSQVLLVSVAVPVHGTVHAAAVASVQTFPVFAVMQTLWSAPTPAPHSSIRLVQSWPPQPDVHAQVYELTLWVHSALFAHGLPLYWPTAHSSMSNWQFVLEKPGTQVQVYASTAWVHAAPFRQGAEPHSSISAAQFSPL
jgi:hypothetical protein